jgi:hypothetical protein
MAVVGCFWMSANVDDSLDCLQGAMATLLSLGVMGKVEKGTGEAEGSQILQLKGAVMREWTSDERFERLRSPKWGWD